jgi:hypothetical protein
MFYVIHNQLTVYTLALPDVSYTVNALSTNTYLEPSPNASININYYRLIEKLKTCI